ncbi:MAG: HAMP domain-containing protein [Actinomycetota bacterium]|nr:HAMP domain-containing protein [Actinomycetota bacterium]
MRRWGPVAIVTVAAVAGATSTLVVASFSGMSGELLHLAQLLLPAVGVTVITSSVAEPLLTHAPVGRRFVALALIGVVVSLANLGVLAGLMLVKQDALLIVVLVVYSAAAGTGAALALSRSFRLGVEKLVETAEQMGRGRLESRAGEVSGGPELAQLAQTLDRMAARLDATIKSEERAVGIRNDLVTAVSHDLRTPLAGLRAMVEEAEAARA